MSLYNKEYRDSVVPVEPVQVIQYLRRRSLVYEDTKNLEPLKDFEQLEQIPLQDDDGDGGDDDEKGKYFTASPLPSTTTTTKVVTFGIPPDGGYGWIIVLCSFILNFIVDGITLTVGLLEEPILKAVNSTTRPGPPSFGISEFSWVNGCLVGVTLLVGPLASVLVDRFGFRLITILGALIAATGICLSWATSPYIPNIYSLIICYGILGGIGFGLIFAPSVVIVTHYFEKRRALATGIAICGSGMGPLVLAPLTTTLIVYFNWSGTIIAQTGIVLLCIIVACFLRQPPTVPPLESIFRSKTEDQNKAKTNSFIRRPSIVVKAPVKVVSSSLRKFIPFLKSPTYMILALSGAITTLGFFSPFTFIPGRVNEITNLEFGPPSCISAMGVSNVIARIIFGFLSDHPSTNNLMMSNIALTIGGLATTLSYLIDSFWLLLVYCVVFGLSTGCFATLRSILILEFIGLEKMNDGFGLSLMFMGITSFFSSPIAGILIEWNKQGYAIAFQAAGCFLIASAILCYPLRYVDRWERSRNMDKQRNKT